MAATISGSGTSTLIDLTTSGNTILGDASTDTLNVGNGGLVKDASGNVGIGTASPATTLHLRSAVCNVRLEDADTSAYANVGVDNSGSMYLQADPANSQASSTMYFSVDGTERMRLDSSGNLLVGTTDAGANTGVGIKIKANQDISIVSSSSTNAGQTLLVYSTTGAAYRFYVGYGGTVYATSTTISAISDIRYKENIRDLDVGLNAVMALKPRLYDWKEGKGADIKNARGFIAQEFETVFPDLIDEWKDPAPEGEEPYKSVRQDLIPVLVKAIQEQQAIITQLQADVAALKGTA